MMGRLFVIIIAWVVSGAGIGWDARAETPDHLFVTGSIMEVDRCVSAWLIKRHIDPKARFAFVEDGQMVVSGTAFDTPDARFRRTHNQATFEMLAAHYKVTDPKVAALGAAIHDIEINFWAGKKDNALAVRINGDIRAIIRAAPNPAQCLEACFTYLDRLEINRH